MSRKQREDTIRRHVILYKEDDEFIKEHFGGQDQTGYSKTVRAIVHAYIKILRDKAERSQQPVKLPEAVVAAIREEE